MRNLTSWNKTTSSLFRQLLSLKTLLVTCTANEESFNGHRYWQIIYHNSHDWRWWGFLSRLEKQSSKGTSAECSSHQACSCWSHCSSTCLMANLTSSLSFKFYASQQPQLIWTVTGMYEDSLYLSQIQLSLTSICQQGNSAGGDLVHIKVLHIWGNQEEVFRCRTQSPTAKSFTKVTVSALYRSLSYQISEITEIRP